MAVWTDGSRLDDGKVGATAVRWEEAHTRRPGQELELGSYTTLYTERKAERDDRTTSATRRSTTRSFIPYARPLRSSATERSEAGGTLSLQTPPLP